MKKSVINAALMAIAAAPIMKHMRDVAYAPINFSSGKKPDPSQKERAEAKRIKRQQRNIKNEQKQTLKLNAN